MNRSRNEKFRNLLKRPGILIAPGAYDAFTGKIIEKTGFDVVYLPGGGTSYSTLGRPDIGLVTMSEMVAKATYLAEAVSLPIVADADTGYGNALNVIRTVKAYERAGISCIQMEDQIIPKRCGHMAGKILVSAEEMVGKVKAACDARTDQNFCIMARTDARAVEGLQQAIDRAHAYREAGADILFIEAPQSEAEMEQLCGEFRGIPLMANMVEGGKTPIIPADRLQELGYKIVIYPSAATRAVAKTITELMRTIKETGSSKDFLDRMYLFDDINTILDLAAIREHEKQYLPRT